MKRQNTILFRITIVLSILALFFFTLAPLNELRQGKVERAEKLSLFPLISMDQMEVELIRHFGMPHKFITTESVVYSILSGMSFGLIIWLAYIIGCTVLYPLFFWLIGKPIRTFTIPKLSVVRITLSIACSILWGVGLIFCLEVASFYLLGTAVFAAVILLCLWLSKKTRYRKIN